VETVKLARLTAYFALTGIISVNVVIEFFPKRGKDVFMINFIKQ
jgi:hypothetical protein